MCAFAQARLNLAISAIILCACSYSFRVSINYHRIQDFSTNVANIGINVPKCADAQLCTVDHFNIKLLHENV